MSVDVDALARGVAYNLDDLRAKVAKATPGEWCVLPYYIHGGTPDEVTRGYVVTDDEMPTGVIDEREAPAENDSISYDLDAIVAIINAARAGLLEDAALGRRVRAAAETDGPDREAIARGILNIGGFGFYRDPMEGGQDAYEITCEALIDAQAAVRALLKGEG